MVRVDALDAEVAASGVTKQMEKDLQAEFGGQERVSDDDEDDDDVSGEDDEDGEDLIEEVVENLEELRQQLEDSVKIVEEKLQSEGIQPKGQRLRNGEADSEDLVKVEDEEDRNDDEKEEDADDVGNLREFNSRFKPFRDGLPRTETDDDSFSVRSVSTTASTIGRSHL